MITSLTLLILSLVALYIGAGWLVQGSSALALKAKISPLVVGLTIVAFGTVHHPFLERDIGADGRAFLSNRYYHLYNIQPLLLPQTWNRRVEPGTRRTA